MMVGMLVVAAVDELPRSLPVKIVEDAGDNQLNKSDTACNGSLVVLLEAIGSVGGVELRVRDVQLVVTLATVTFTKRLELEV